MRFAPILILLVPFILSGCVERNYVYRAAPVKPCFFTEKGDMNLELNLSAYQGFRAAYAVSDQFFVSAAIEASVLDRDTFINNSAQEVITEKRLSEFEVGGGFFSVFSEHGVIEHQLNFAMRSDYMRNVNLSNSFRRDTRYYRYTYQPAVGIVTEVVDFGFIPRLSLVSYPEYDDWDLLVEPTLYYRLGYRHIKFMGQLGVTAPLYYDSKQYDYSSIPIRLAIGFHYTINRTTRNPPPD